MYIHTCTRTYTHSHTHTHTHIWTFLVPQHVKNPPAMWETRVWSLGWEDPLEKGMATHSSILAWRITMDSPWGCKETDTTEQFTSLHFTSCIYIWSEVAQSCPTLCDPMDCNLLGFSIHGILQARILEWIAISFSKGSSQPRDRTRVSCIGGRRFNLWATREALEASLGLKNQI